MFPKVKSNSNFPPETSFNSKSPITICKDHGQELCLICVKAGCKNALVCLECINKNHQGHHLIDAESYWNSKINSLLKDRKKETERNTKSQSPRRALGDYYYWKDADSYSEEKNNYAEYLMRGVSPEENSELGELCNNLKERSREWCKQSISETKTQIHITLQEILNTIDEYAEKAKSLARLSTLTREIKMKRGDIKRAVFHRSFRKVNDLYSGIIYLKQEIHGEFMKGRRAKPQMESVNILIQTINLYFCYFNVIYFKLENGTK